MDWGWMDECLDWDWVNLLWMDGRIKGLYGQIDGMMDRIKKKTSKKK